MAGLWNQIGSSLYFMYDLIPSLSWQKEDVQRIIEHHFEMARPNIIFRLAGLSGAIAVAMGAYGAHAFRPNSEEPRLKEVFDTGYRMHMIHSVALMGTTLASRPLLVGSMMGMGTLLFSGSCYYHALTGNSNIRFVTPYGGMLLIIAWLAMIF